MDKPTWQWPSENVFASRKLQSDSLCAVLMSRVLALADKFRACARDLPAELMRATTEFSETVEYKNVILAAELGEAQINRNLEEYGANNEPYKPILKGTFLWIKADTMAESSSPASPVVRLARARSASLANITCFRSFAWQDPGWNVPLWCARVLSDEAPDVDPRPEDTFEIEWWGSFDHRVLRDDMSHKYKPMCCGWCFVKVPTGGTDANGRKLHAEVRRFHDYDATKCHKGKDSDKHGPSTPLR